MKVGTMFTGSGALSFALFALAAATPAVAQEDQAAILQQIDESLPGTLINDPTSLDWRVAGTRLRLEPAIDPEIPGGGAANQFDVRRAGSNPWDVQAYVPLTRDVQVGETITFGFWARTIESDAEDGQGHVTARIQRDADPWPGFGDTPITIDSDWRWHEVQVQSDRQIPQDEAFLVFQLAAARQIVQIGQTIVVSGADRIIGDGARPAPPLPPQLAGRGTLLSQPDTRDFALRGAQESFAAHEDSAIYLGRAVRVTSASAADQAWNLEVAVPIAQGIAQGDELELAIAARTLSAQTEDGRARIGTRIQQTAAPFEGFADNTFTVGANWQLVRIRTTASRELAPGTAVIALHFAGAAQVVDLGPVYLIRLDPAP